MKPADQTIDDAGAVLFGGLGQLSVARCGIWVGMTQQALDVAQA
jgi:hypothetical protein